MIKEGKWNLDKDVDKMWNDCIKRVAKDALGESKRCRQLTKKVWWWNKEVQIAIRLKRERESYRSSPRCRDNAVYGNYKVVNKI